MPSIETLPTELVCRIAEFTLDDDRYYFSGKRVARSPESGYYGCHQNALARTCRRFYAILNPILYRRNLTKDHPLNSCVFWAVKHDQLGTIKIAVANGADLNATGEYDNNHLRMDFPPTHLGTALHLAILLENMRIFDYLLDSGVNVHLPSMGLCCCCSPSEYAAYPLHLAINHPEEEDRESFKPFVARLINHGAYLMSAGQMAVFNVARLGYYDIIKPMLQHADSGEMTCLLFMALQQGDIENVSLILKYPSTSPVSHVGFGQSALHQAVSTGTPEMLELLIHHWPDADLSMANYFGNTPLHTAVSSDSHVPHAKLLLEQPGIKVNATNNYGDTPLALAALRGVKDAVELLLAHPEIDVNAVGGGGRADLNAFQDIDDAVGLILAHPDVDINAAGGGGRTALHAAASNGAGEIFELLFNHPGIDVNGAGRDGHTPLHAAAEICDREVFDMLLAHPNIDVHACTNDGRTLLHMVPLAAKNKKTPPEKMIEIFDQLLDYGLPINQVSSEAATALSLAVDLEEYALALHLLDKGADPHIEAHHNGTRNLLVNSAVHACGGKAQEQLFRELLSRQVPFDETSIDANDPEPRDDQGTPLFFAAAYAQNPTIVELLLRAGANPRSKVRKGEDYLTKYGDAGDQQLLLPAVFRLFWGMGTVADDDITDSQRTIISMLVRAGSCIGRGGAGCSALEFAMSNDTTEEGAYELVTLLLHNATVAQVEYEHVRDLIYRYAMYKQRTREAIMDFAAKWFPERFAEDNIPERAEHESWSEEEYDDEE